MRYFDDIAIGEKRALGRHTFAADEIKAFATKFDPQPFHVDEAAATRSHFRALCASGWHTASMWMRFAAEHRRREEEEQRARGEKLARRGPSPGLRNLQWLRPVYVGDTIAFASEVVDKRPLKTRPGWGLVTSRNTGANQNGDLVLSFLGTVFVESRPR